MFPHKRDRILHECPDLIIKEPQLGTLEQAEDYRRLKAAGTKLAIAAAQVATEYDGCHRLLQAVSEWFLVCATEGGRPESTAAQ